MAESSRGVKRSLRNEIQEPGERQVFHTDITNIFNYYII